MRDYFDTEEYQNSYDNQAYQDYLEESFYEFLYGMRIACMLSRASTQPNDLNDIKSFWEVA